VERASLPRLLIEAETPSFLLIQVFIGYSNKEISAYYKLIRQPGYSVWNSRLADDNMG